MTAPTIAPAPPRRGRRGPLPGSPRGPRLTKAERVAQIAGVAERMFSERGFDSTTMEMVAEAAGITKPVIYDHFGSKEGLLTAVIDSARDELTTTINQAWREVQEEESPKASFRAGLVAFFRFMDEHNGGWRSLVRKGGISSLAIDEARAAQTATVLGALTRFPELEDVPPLLVEGAIQGLVGACERISIWRTEREEITPEDAADIVMSLAWYGIGSLVGGNHNG
ncbi:MAG: TetR/AcrR family transcriptional regulator [Tetrasphaera sp.]|jgi:AcrR family transcriptional regulator|nr:TetR/AcrR family transcriptional regulator [Tetrasphaera sp.]